jgi:hypothetical protein
MSQRRKQAEYAMKIPGVSFAGSGVEVGSCTEGTTGGKRKGDGGGTGAAAQAAVGVERSLRGVRRKLAVRLHWMIRKEWDFGTLTKL